MKKLILVLSFLFATHNAMADYDRGHIIRFQGRINFGPYINCDLTNHEPYSLYQILSYRYTVTFINQWNQVQVGHHNLRCGFGCEVRPFHTVRLTGPQNGHNVIGARCDVTVRIHDFDRHGDDDYPHSAPILGGDNSGQYH